MPTNRRRLNITLTKEADMALQYIAKRDSISESAVALSLMTKALELEEDQLWDTLAAKRDDQARTTYVDHETAWQ